MASHSLFPDIDKVGMSKKDVELFIYADEIKEFKNSIGESWMYIGILLLKADDKERILNDLLKKRKEVNYQDELHFRDLTNYSYANIYSEKTKLAKSWIDFVLSENKKRSIYFHILGLNLTNLQHQAFGSGKKRMRNIYNRFFRSTILYCLKSYFDKHKNILVKQIFHDKGHLDNDELFDWHTIWRIGTAEDKISFASNCIYFIDSDHYKETNFTEESHFIQLIDLILGATCQCLDANSNKDGCGEVARIFLPLIERLNGVNNPNSRYDYFKKCGLSFFPKKHLTLEQLNDQWERVRSGFYQNRPLFIKDRFNQQMRLEL